MFGVGISWVYVSLHEYGHAPAAFAALVTLLLVLFMIPYPLAVGYFLARLRPGAVKWLLVAPALWALLEWVRGWLFTGFPWLALGYSQIDGPLAGLAPSLGVFGVSWAVMVSAGLVLMLFHRDWRRGLSSGGAIVVFWSGAWGLGQLDWVEPVGEPIRVSLVQGNIPQDQKFDPDRLQSTLRHYARLSSTEAAGSDVIIWPETAIPVFYRDAEGFVRSLEAQARGDGVDYLIGVPSGSWDEGVFHNSVVSLGRSHGFYHKHRLLPFGEYLPLRSLLTFFHSLVDIPMADFTAGRADQALLRAGGHPVGVSICFEAVFGDEIRLSLPQARFLVNVSNDAWFGDSLAPHQHLQIARMRALEAGRYLARATNTGISAFVDNYGRITARSEQFRAEVLQARLQPLQGVTPYVRMGNGAIVTLLAVLLVLGVVLTRSNQSNSKQNDRFTSLT
jgi:apolipoprotein N-acyltransferase